MNIMTIDLFKHPARVTVKSKPNIYFIYLTTRQKSYSDKQFAGKWHISMRINLVSGATRSLCNLIHHVNVMNSRYEMLQIDSIEEFKMQKLPFVDTDREGREYIAIEDIKENLCLRCMEQLQNDV